MFSNCILHATVLRDRETEILIFYKFGKQIIFELLSGGKFEFTFGLSELLNLKTPREGQKNEKSSIIKNSKYC